MPEIPRQEVITSFRSRYVDGVGGGLFGNRAWDDQATRQFHYLVVRARRYWFEGGVISF